MDADRWAERLRGVVEDGEAVAHEKLPGVGHRERRRHPYRSGLRLRRGSRPRRPLRCPTTHSLHRSRPMVQLTLPKIAVSRVARCRTHTPADSKATGDPTTLAANGLGLSYLTHWRQVDGSVTQSATPSASESTASSDRRSILPVHPTGPSVPGTHLHLADFGVRSGVFGAERIDLRLAENLNVLGAS